MKKTFYSLSILFLFLFQTNMQAQSWSKLGGSNDVNANTLCIDKAGNIYAAGFITNTSYNYYVAKYNGITWDELGGLNALHAGAWINSICSDASGNIYAAGQFVDSLNKFYVAKYNGTAWSELGGSNDLNANNTILSICSDASGNIYATGTFTNEPNAGSGDYYVAKYDGTSWSALGGLNGLSANSYIETICSDVLGNIYAAGYFRNDSNYQYVAKYDGTNWSELGGVNGLRANAGILSICSDSSGNIYAAGSFSHIAGNRYVSKYNGTTWSELGGLNSLNANNDIHSICIDVSGNIYAAGGNDGFTSTGYVEKYNGTAWGQLGGFNCILSICSDAMGNIYVSGDQNNVYEYPATATGIRDINLINSIDIFPNPANHITTISLSNNISGATIKLFNITGQAIIEKTNQSGNKLTLDISTLPQGIYFLQVQQQDNLWTTKLLKED